MAFAFRKRSLKKFVVFFQSISESYMYMYLDSQVFSFKFLSSGYSTVPTESVQAPQPMLIEPVTDRLHR